MTAARILVLDDDPVNRSLIEAILTRADDGSIRGATLHAAGSLAEARAILGSEAIDLVLLDVHLPDGLGLDLAAELQRDGASRPAILALTASVLPADQQAALDAGCDAFLAKPFPGPALIATCVRLLEKRPRQAAAPSR
jgi:two-component system, OmpR family, KDP operon response regulator KdpE